ncbi:MAG: hypothetical protein NXI00_24570, partial [Cytophagales bacterium]|nr:hypothetical protein [Cytophagales bacterium]
ETWDEISDAAQDFIDDTLINDPHDRLSLEQILHHPWLQVRHTTVIETTLTNASTPGKKVPEPMLAITCCLFNSNNK